MKIAFGVFCILVLSVVALNSTTSESDTPSTPQWPNKFTENFHEIFDYPVVGRIETNGRFYYDFSSKRYRVDRDNGKGDRYCGINGLKWLKNTPCSQFVVNGDRYIYYPQLNECCYCCSAEHGCGILKTDWLSGASFLGVVQYNGQSAYKWDKAGLQSNFYYETMKADPLERVMLGMDQQPNDEQQFNPATWSKSFDDSYLALPSICKKSTTCALASTCTAARNV